MNALFVETAAAGNVYRHLGAALAAGEIEDKLWRVAALVEDWTAGQLSPDAESVETARPGWPLRLKLVKPQAVVQRAIGTPMGHAALVHAVAHIEYSAINLALDHALRFVDVPVEYLADWILVAGDEARHFVMLRNRLLALGYDYGDFPAHHGLWQMAEKTAHDPLARMALVPRLLEARGLDATPPIRARLVHAGDEETARVLDVILRDEIRHVAIGDYWFRHFCTPLGLEPEATYRRLIAEYAAPWPQHPLNQEARLEAGFSASELAELSNNRPLAKRGESS